MTRSGIGRIETRTIKKKDFQVTVHAVKLKRLGKHIPGGPRHICDYCPLPTEQGIEETGFPGIWTTYKHHDRYGVESFDRDGTRQSVTQWFDQCAHGGDQCLHGDGDHILLIGEIDSRFHQPGKSDDLRGDLPSEVTESAFGETMGGSELRVGLGADRLRDSFGLKKIYSAVEISPCRVFAGTCITKGNAESVSPIIELASNPFDERSSAGDQKFDDVVTGVTVRSGSDEAQNGE